MADPLKNELHFDVSSGLKSVLGSELITDDEVAIFELVKNSFDASAKNVEVYFGSNSIIVADDGEGMTFEDLRTKWLFVGFSAKREQNREDDFRDAIERRKHYAGSKGVGRMSSDRLGNIVSLQTRGIAEVTGPIHHITVDWSQFDDDHHKKFEEIGVEYEEIKSEFTLPNELSRIRNGTAITIEQTRKHWDRDSIIRLKTALAKLINPFGASADGFKITIIAPGEKAADQGSIKKAKKEKREPLPSEIVNGEVSNFIFATLQEKTTLITVAISECGKFINSSLIDRGELIYKVREPNPYDSLAHSGFRCELYFLNQSAKATFTRRMGVNSVAFGSVFLFRNGFRVFPVGEDGDDWFKMDRRRAQGYARFLGTRDVIGRIDVAGKDDDFKEASSRNTGLIETDAVQQLRRCFIKNCLTRLEKYVVPVTYPDKEDKLSSDTSRLRTDPGKARVTSAVATLVNNKEVELLEYSKNLIGILSERSENFETSLKSLRLIAENTKDKSLFNKIEAAEQRFSELKKREEAARKQADEERKAKEKAQADAEKAKAEAEKAKQSEAEAKDSAESAKRELDEEKKRNLFLTSISTLDTETVLNLHHQVTIYAVDVQQQLENLTLAISGEESVKTSDILDRLEGITLLNSKILGIAKFATKANFRMKSERIKDKLSDYIEQYINDIAKDYLPFGLRRVTVSADGEGEVQEFKPIDVSVVIDNLIANARKANATRVNFKITHPHKGALYLEVADNGNGFSDNISDLERVFEKGFTTTEGSGLGLFHVRQVLGEMNGTIEAQKNSPKGAKFLIKIAK